jgi:hypothetical protein
MVKFIFSFAKASRWENFSDKEISERLYLFYYGRREGLALNALRPFKRESHLGL